MYRAHGAPELQREDIAVDVLCERIARLKRRLRYAVVATSLAAAAGALYLSSNLTSPIELGGRAVGLAFATALLGTLFGTNEVAVRLTLAFAERWARDLAAERRCDAEPLLDAARLLAGGRR